MSRRYQAVQHDGDGSTKNLGKPTTGTRARQNAQAARGQHQPGSSEWETVHDTGRRERNGKQ